MRIRTLDSLTFLLPSGTVIDTAAPDADAVFRRREPRWSKACSGSSVTSNHARHCRSAFAPSTKPRTPPAIRSTLPIDFARPVDIMQDVLIGSERTLALIAEAVLNTVPDLPVKYAGLLLFPNLHAACAAIVPLRDAGAAALELMDRASCAPSRTRPACPFGKAAARRRRRIAGRVPVRRQRRGARGASDRTCRRCRSESRRAGAVHP